MMPQVALPANLLDWLVPLALVYARVQACLMTMPAIGERVLPVRVRIAAAMALVPLYAMAAPPVPLPGILQLAALMGVEILSGLVLGLMVRVVAMALDVGATAIAQSASLSAMLGMSDEMAPHPIGNLLHMAGMALLMALGLPLFICQVLTDSFALKPAGLWPDIGVIWPGFWRLAIHSLTLSMLIAAPFILGGLLFQMLAGVVARVMPAMPIVFVAAPAAILLALAALALLVPGLLSIWARDVLSLQPAVLR